MTTGPGGTVVRGFTFPIGPLGVTFYASGRAVGFAVGIRRRLKT